MKLYHGTDKEIQAGEYLNPQKNWIDGKEEKEKTHAVFATPLLNWAQCFAFCRAVEKGLCKISPMDTGFLIVSNNCLPFDDAKDTKIFVYELPTKGFARSNPEKKGGVEEYISHGPVKVMQTVAETTVGELLKSGYIKLYTVPDEIMKQTWGNKNIKAADIINNPEYNAQIYYDFNKALFMQQAVMIKDRI